MLLCFSRTNKTQIAVRGKKGKEGMPRDATTTSNFVRDDQKQPHDRRAEQSDGASAPSAEADAIFLDDSREVEAAA